MATDIDHLYWHVSQCNVSHEIQAVGNNSMTELRDESGRLIDAAPVISTQPLADQIRKILDIDGPLDAADNILAAAIALKERGADQIAVLAINRVLDQIHAVYELLDTKRPR